MAWTDLFARPAFASGGASPYLGGMRVIPRPVSPRDALADLKLMFSPDRPHRWTFLGLAVTLTALSIWGFYLEFRPPKLDRQIIYVQSWPAGRKDSDIIRQQIQDLATYEAQLEANQLHYQKFADSMGIEWRKEAAENKKHRLAAEAEMKKRLEKKLADALAKEAAEGNSAESDAGRSGADTKTL